MAVGFTPKHTENIPFDNLNKEQFLTLTHESAKKLKWEIGYISDTGLIGYTNSGFLAWNSEFKVILHDDSAVVSSTSVGSEMMDWGKNKKIVNRFKEAFEEVKANLSAEELEDKHQEFKELIVSEEDDILKLPPATTTEEIKSFFSIFVPSKDFFFTPILIDLNILMFLLMALNGVSLLEPTGESLIAWGGNFRPATLDGQLWRLISNCFIHIGVFHLLLNMYALLYIGTLLEPILGKSRYIAAYLLTGIVASLTSLWWHDLTISAGASGAIFGMYGVFLALLTTDLIEKSARKALLTSIGIFVVYNLIYGLKGGIDNAAHIGGLLSGGVIGYAFVFSLKRPADLKMKYGIIGSLGAVILFSSFVICKTIPNDIIKYEEIMKEFVESEKKALHVFSLPPDTPKEDLLYQIKDVGIYYWEENIKLLETQEKMSLPEAIQKRNKILKEYCDIRILSYETLYKSINEESSAYDEKLKEYSLQIQNIMSELEASAQDNP